MKNENRNLQNELKESANKIWLAGLGALTVAGEEGNKLFKSLVEKGEAYETKGRQTVSEVKNKVEDTADRVKGEAESAMNRVESKVDEVVASALQRAGVPTRDEIATLTRRVEELTRLVEQLNKKAA